MSSDSTSRLERLCASLQQENAALKRNVEWLSRQLFGRVMPGLLTFSGFKADEDAEESPADEDAAERPSERDAGRGRGSMENAFREPSAPYRVSSPSSAPPDLPSEDVTLELPAKECAGMTIVGYERAEAIGMRPAAVRRHIRRAMYIPNDGSGLASAAEAPALFPDPSGGELVFDASFVAYVADLRISGMEFRAISERLNRENGLAISGEALRALTLAAAEAVAPVCTSLFVRTLPDWMNLRRQFEDAKAGGDWFAEEFLRKIHALFELEEHARVRAERLGGAPEDLYRERRAARRESARVVSSFFERCREMSGVLDAGSPLAETIRHALEHESILSGFLYNPRLELSRANPETPLADPFAMLAVCADECRTRGVSFRAWLERVLTALKQAEPPPPDSLFPR